MDKNKVTISPSQAKLVLKSLREVEDRLHVVCRICDDSQEIKDAEKQLAELSKLIESIDTQTKSPKPPVKKRSKRKSVTN
ncbi:MAG: hypothetical protein OEZ68_09195 [Gammaproteobacteria bacterium]|nr:hypothetical protein [Gammaproteobacteria bacterium]MDH5800963.1 hypothetical protein [Gammaproteobacteria bacterium]